MYMFNMNQHYNQPIAVPIVVPIVVPIHIQHVYSSVSYQRAIYQKYNWRGRELPGGPGMGL